MSLKHTASVLFLLSTISVFSLPALAQGPGAVSAAPVSSHAAPRPSPGITLDDALLHAWQHNPTLKAARAARDATRELYPQAVAGWRPSVNAEGNLYSTDVDSSNFSQGTGATTKAITLSLDQPLYRGGRTTAETARAKHLIAAADSDFAQTGQIVFLRATSAYMDVIRDQALLDIRRNNQERLETELKAAQERFRAGELTKTDVKQAEARLSAARSAYINAAAALETSRASFEKEVGFQPAEMLRYPERTFPFPATLDEMVAEAEQRNPGLSVSKEQHEAARKDIKRYRSDYLPQISAYASYNKEYDPQPGIISDSAVKTIGVRARLALYQGGADRARVREAKSTAIRREYEIAETRDTLREDIASQWREYMAARAEISVRQAEVEASRAAREGVSEEARMGERTVLDVLDADQEVLNAEAALIQAQHEAVMSSFLLAASLGYLTPDALGIHDGDMTAN